MLEISALVRSSHYRDQADITALRERQDSQAITRMANLFLKYGCVQPEPWKSILCVYPLARLLYLETMMRWPLAFSES